MKKPEVVYQYLKYSTFEKMVSNKTIRLSDIQKSNDSTELQLVFALIKRVFYEEYLKDKKKYKYIDEYLTESDFANAISSMLTPIGTVENVLHTQFVSCFSRNGDLLSQWRGYAEEYIDHNHSIGGISVGFRTNSLEKLTGTKYGEDFLTFGPVQYRPKMQKSLLRTAIQEKTAIIRQYIKDNKTINGFDMNQLMVDCHSLVIQKGAYIKNDFFFEEQEWRLCHWGQRNNIEHNYPLTADINLSNKDSTKEKLFFDLCMGDRINEFICDVIIGPKCEHNKEDVKDILSRTGITCEPTLSRGYNVYVESSNHKKA